MHSINFLCEYKLADDVIICVEYLLKYFKTLILYLGCKLSFFY